MHRAIDLAYQRLSTRFGLLRFFEDGLGELSSHVEWVRSLCRSPLKDPLPIGVSWVRQQMPISKYGTMTIGEFQSPVANLAGMPRESRWGRFMLLEPSVKVEEGGKKRAIVHLAGTGDHGFSLRAFSLGVPLLRDGVASVVLENPLYGKRKPEKQRGAKLRQVRDLLLLGRATIEEARSLLWWLRTKRKCEQLSTVGHSMGGLHAAMAASLMSIPVGIVATHAPPSAIEPFIFGIMRHSMSEKALPHLPTALQTTDIRNFPKTKQRAILLTGEADQLSLPHSTPFPSPLLFSSFLLAKKKKPLSHSTTTASSFPTQTLPSSCISLTTISYGEQQQVHSSETLCGRVEEPLAVDRRPVDKRRTHHWLFHATSSSAKGCARHL